MISLGYNISISRCLQLYDVAFFVLIPVIMLAIVSGIIIDGFGASRDARNEVYEDQKNNCFICSLQSSKFERMSRGFDYHVRHEHNMWQYIYLMAYLQLKVNIV